MRRREFLAAIGFAAAPIVIGTAWSQTYPMRPVRMIVPLAAGGPTDVFARLIAQNLSGFATRVSRQPGVTAGMDIARTHVLPYLEEREY